MGTCKDAKDYIDEFIELMKNESDFMVDRILTTLYDAGLKSPKLTQCYEWLAEKHKDGGILRQNLKRALGRELFDREKIR